MAPNRESLSEQSKRRTNYVLLAFGIILSLLFLMAWCQMRPKEQKQVIQKSTEEGYGVDSFVIEDTPGAGLPNLSSRGDAQLVVTPTEVVMTPNVVIGSEAEAPITLRADNAPILLLSKKLAEEQPDGFTLSGSCMELERLNKDQECILKVSWAPKTLRNIQNTLTIEWREHNTAIFRNERTTILLKAQSTDSKDCVICCEEKEKEKERSVEGVGPDGKPVDPNDPSLEKTKEGLLQDKETGKIKGVTEPDKAALNLSNELLGDIAKNGDVINKEGKVVGRLLLDNTIIDPNTFAIIGKAIYLMPAMNESGHVFGRLVTDEKGVSVVDAKGKVVGFAHVDDQIVDAQNQPIGFISPWGGVIDSVGHFLGVILPDGSVLNEAEQRVAFMRPMGFAVNEAGALVGGVVPHGIGVGAGCRSLGEVSLNGMVKDSFGQSVGHALLDHSVVDSQMNELGSVVRQGVIIDQNGKALGFVNSEGKAVNFKGASIGCVNPDKTVFAHKKFVGALMPQGQITKGGCSRVGSVYPDGNVMDRTLKKVGYITPAGTAYDDKKQELGKVVPWGTAIAEGCRLLGLISLNGDVVSTDGVKMGCVNLDDSVQNLQGQLVGKVTPLGIFVNNQNRVVGRVRLDGQIMDNKGDIVGCVYEGSQQPGQFVGRNTQGVIVDENGLPLGGTSVGNKAYDEVGNWIGDVYFNGWVIGERGHLIGVVPFSGLIYSDKGELLGSYNQLTGLFNDRANVGLGRVLPNLTVINLTGTEILGKLIPENTGFVKTDGTFLGNLKSDGKLMNNGEVISAIIHANGTVTDNEGRLIGGAVSSGPVLSGAGKYMGLASVNGEVVNNQNLKIGRVLANGLAISDRNQVMGKVFPELSVAVSAQGFIGAPEPKIIGSSEESAYQLQINDSKGNVVGNTSGYGVVLGNDNSISGRLLPVVPAVTQQGKLMGWANFKGEINNQEGRMIGSVLPSGAVLDMSQSLSGSLIETGIAVDTLGGYLGHIDSKGQLLSSKGEVIATKGTTSFLYDIEGAIIGQILRPGIAVSGNGLLLGWTRDDGQIENGTKILGQVGLDGHVFDVNGQMIGRYLPLGSEVFNDEEKSVGFTTETGEIIEASGLSVAKMGYEPYVATNGTIIGRFLDDNRFISNWEAGRILGMVESNGKVVSLGVDKTVGSLMMNRQFANVSHQTSGGLVSVGLALTPTLGIIGEAEQDGQIYKTGKKVGVTTGAGLVYSVTGDLLGGIYTPNVVIDKKGSVVGMTSGTPAITYKGKQIGNKLAFSSGLSTTNEWLGNTMPSGGIVNDIGAYQGIITNEGLVTGAQNVFMGRVLPDGSVAGVPERAVLNTMPYIGHTITQGLPIAFQGNKVLGKTTTLGDIVDDAGKKLFRITDNGYILNKPNQQPISPGRVFPFISAVDNQGKVLGAVSENGTIVSYSGQVRGKVDNNGLIRLNELKSETDELKIQGLLIPEDLVANNCKIVGQTAYDGRVINGQGSVVGRIRRDKWAVDANGAEIGRVVRNNQPCITKDRQYMGRSLPDSTVVDLNGVEIGCATNSGEMLDFNGELLCKIVERGVIFDKDGNPIGFLRADGTGWDGEKVIGTADWDGNFYDLNGNKIGWIPQDQTIFMNEDGTLKYTQGGDDWLHSKNGDLLYKIDPDGNAETAGGWKFNLDEGFPTCIDGIGCLIGCDFFGMDRQKIASLMADGTLRDDNGDLIYTVAPDGQVFAPNGSLVGQFQGLDVGTALKRCGMAGASGASAGRRLNIGNRIITVGSDGTLVDEDGMIIGYMGEDGRPYTLGNKPITGSDIGGRERPDTSPRFKPTQTQLDDFQEKLAQKRKGMKTQLGKGILTISKEMEARAKPKKDKDWSRPGLDVPKSVSGYPVDMSHVVLQGKAIPAVLARSIDSRYSEVPAIAIVEKNVYGEEGRNVLIPAGSRLIGSFSGNSGAEQQNGVAKLQISWNRLIRPDGAAFNLSGAQSGDAQGRGAVAAYLDEQLWNKYGSSILGVLAESSVAYMLATNDDVSTSTAEGGTTSQTNKSQAANNAREEFIKQIGEIVGEMIDRASATPPVVFVPAGTRLTVFPAQDLWLRSVDDDVAEVNEEFGAPSTEAQVPDMDSWTAKRKQEMDERDSPSPQTQTSAQKETETPLYDGRDRMPDLSDRKVEPITPENEKLF